MGGDGRGMLIFCAICRRAVEGVLLASGATACYATTPIADDHARAHGHWPDPVHIHEADPRALRLVGTGGR